MSGKRISIRLLSLLLSLVLIVTSIPLGAIAAYAVKTSKELDRQLSYEKRYEKEGRKVSPETQAVYDFICDKYGSNMITAQQESTWVDNNPDWEMDYLMENTGKLPAIRGFDYIGSNVGETTEILTKNDFEGVNKRAIEWWRKGGIVTICWHTGSNFTGGYQNSKKDNPPDWDKVLTEGTDENKKFKDQMAQGAIALQKLRDAGVPVLWRPFHEFDGGWFWWGKFNKNILTPITGNWDIDNEKFKKLWKMMYDLYTNEYGLNNLIWVYGYSQVTEDPSGLYPGDEYVDILGPDNYEKNIVTLFNKVNGVNAKRPICLHECGTNPTESQWNSAPYSYFMTWHTGWLTGSESNSSNTVDSLNQLYNSELAITLDELPVFEHTHKAGEVKQENIIKATCTEEGSYNDVTYCAYERCNEIVSTEAKTIPALGHSFTNYVFDNNKTETSEGTRTAECDNGCGTTNTVAVDPNADTKAIKNAMAAFEDILKNGGVYTNLPEAYKAYIEASKAYDSYYYGGNTSVDINKKATNLNNAVNNMQVWTFVRKTANNNKGIWKMNNSDNPMTFDDSYTPSSENTGLGESVTYYSHQNILYAGIADKDLASVLKDTNMSGWLRYQPITMMYDGVTAPQAPIMLVYGTVDKKNRYTVGIVLSDNDNNSLKLVNKWLFSRSSSYGNNFDWSSAYKQIGSDPNCISQSYPAEWNVQLGKYGVGGWTTTPGMANLYYFGGTFSDDEYLKEITPTITCHSNGDNNYTSQFQNHVFTPSGTISNNQSDYRIHVINYKAIIDSANKYTKNVKIPTDITNYKEGGLQTHLDTVDSIGNTLNNFDPNTYFTSATSLTDAGTNNYQACANEIERICELVKNVNSSDTSADKASQYPALRTAMDKSIEIYKAGRTSAYSVKSYNAFKAAYEEAMNVMSKVNADGYASGNLAEAAATQLETAFTALKGPCEAHGEAHAWSLVNATTPATCTKDGFGDFICTKCEEPDSHEITKLGHKHDKAYNQDKSHIFEYCTLCKEKFGDVDLTAYNAQVALANDALGRTDKYKDLKNLSETLRGNVATINSTQAEVDSYCKNIETAYNALDLKEYNLTFKIMVGNEEKSSETKTYKYGDVVPLNVGTEYSPYKWTREGYDLRIANATNEVSVAIYNETIIYAYCDDDKAQTPANQHKVTIYNKFNKAVSYMYVENGTVLSFNGSTITASDAQEYKFEKTPFYQVTGYKAGSTAISGSTYTVNEDVGIYPIYSAQSLIEITLDKTNANIRFSDDATAPSKTALWDQKITVEADQEVIWYVGNVAVAKGTSYTFRASNSMTISAQAVTTEKGSSIITYSSYDSENNKLRYAVSSYQSEKYAIEEQGIIVGTSTKSHASYNKDVIVNNGKKFVASKTTDTGDQFSYSISLGTSVSVVKTICAVSYVKYENISTPVYSDVNYIYLD